MKIYFHSLKGVFVFTALFSLVQLSAQNSECKVLIPEISGTYAGDCKNGLAHGNGTATGIDRYEGQFNKGLPHGRGTYAWTNGPVYRGEWSKGLQNGEGEIIYFTAGGDSTVKGFWKGGAYIGKTVVPAYTVIRKDNLLSCNFRKLDKGNTVIVKFMLKGQINSRVKEMSMVYSSGMQFKSGANYQGIQDVYFPFNLVILYTTYNPISRGAFDVQFECTINEPGKWEIILNN